MGTAYCSAQGWHGISGIVHGTSNTVSMPHADIAYEMCQLHELQGSSSALNVH